MFEIQIKLKHIYSCLTKKTELPAFCMSRDY